MNVANDTRCENCDLEELERSERHELEGEALAVMEDLGFEIVTHNERDGTCFGCSLSRMLDRLAAAAHEPSAAARTLAKVTAAMRKAARQ